mgnify:CR=1 FL=1
MNILHLFSKLSLRQFRIPFSDIPKGVKIRNWWYDGKTKNGSKIDVYEEKKGLMFKVELTDKEKEEYEKSAEYVSRHYKVPLYTFRCANCNEIWLLPFVANKVILPKKSGIEVLNICQGCFNRHQK